MNIAKQKSLSVLLDIARAHAGQHCHTAKQALGVFGYSPSTYLYDTKAYHYGLIEPISQNYELVGYTIADKITKCYSLRGLRELAALPTHQRQYVSVSIIQQVRQELRGLWADDESTPRVIV